MTKSKKDTETGKMLYLVSNPDETVTEYSVHWVSDDGLTILEATDAEFNEYLDERGSERTITDQ